MAKKKNDKREENKTQKLSLLNRSLYAAAQKIMSLIDSDYSHREELDEKSADFQRIIDRELDLANGVSHGSIIDFVQSQRERNVKQNNDQNGYQVSNSQNIFTENIDQIYSYLTELYSNKYMEMLDLRYICKFIPVLGEAVKTTLNHICTADGIAEGINRTIEFDIPIENDIRKIIENAIIEFEKNTKLQKKLKNFSFKQALTIGSSFIYRISYNELFEMYDKKKRAQKAKNGVKYMNNPFNMDRIDSSTESFNTAYCDSAIESATNIINEIPDKMFTSNRRSDVIKGTSEEIRDIFSSFHFDNGDGILREAYEEAFCYREMQEKQNSLLVGMEAKMTPVSDGVRSPNEKESMGISGSYIKFIKASDIAPLKIFDQVVGYYRITSKKKTRNKMASTVTNTGILSTSIEISNQKKEKVMDSIVDSVSNMILENFDQKFLIENQEFKKLIADCVVSKGITDNEFSIQFIPAKYIYAFNINEDEDGHGQSMLAGSVFAGKTLLSYLVSKLLLFVNNAGDKTLVTMHHGPIDLNGKNQVSRVIRDLEGQNISFGDFLSPNIMFSKFNRNTNIVIPTSNNGTKMLEFEKLEGKTLDMQPDMEDKLEKMSLVGSSVPDTIMEYTNDLQFSRQITSSNIKYAGDISSWQNDLEDPTTDLYRDCCRDMNLPEEAKRYLNHMFIKLPRPKIASNTNNSDAIRVSKEIADLVAEMYYGQEPKQEDLISRLHFILEMCKTTMPYLDWNKYDELFEMMNVKYHGPLENITEDTGDTGGEDY